MQQEPKETVEKMEMINKVDKDYLRRFLFGGKDPFIAGISIDEIYRKCTEALTAEALLSAN